MKHIVLTAAFCLFSLLTYSQISNHPPEPMASTEDGGWQGCAEDYEPGDEIPITPPPGLCMPIDDYIMPLLIVGLIFGAYSAHKIYTVQKI